jgi:hypothetical protein
MELESPLSLHKIFKLLFSIATTDLINGDCTSTNSSCSENQVAMFLLGVKRGGVLAGAMDEMSSS